MSSEYGEYQYWQSGDGKWRWRKVAGNHEVECASGGQGYSTKGNCIQAIGRDMESAHHYEMKEVEAPEVKP